MVGICVFCVSSQSMAVFSEVTVNALGEECNVSFTSQLYFVVCHSFQHRTIVLSYFLSLL